MKIVNRKRNYRINDTGGGADDVKIITRDHLHGGFYIFFHFLSTFSFYATVLGLLKVFTSSIAKFSVLYDKISKPVVSKEVPRYAFTAL